MKLLLTPMEMYALEAAHFASTALPTIALMERAAHAIADLACELLGEAAGKRVLVACGSGNNGGDGYAAARFLRERGVDARCLPIAQPSRLKGDAELEYRYAREAAVPLSDWQEESPAPDLWIDALFGIGLNRPLGDEYVPLLARIERDRLAGCTVLAVDVPSGLNARTGEGYGRAVKADCTLTFQAAKTGHYLSDGPDCTGRLVVADIGIAPSLFPTEAVRLVEPSDARAALPPRRHNSHKGTYGHLLIVAGSFGMAGAASLCALSALRGGAGLVTVACPGSIVPVVQTLAPCAMCLPMPETDGALNEAASAPIRQALAGKTVAVVGPGLSRRAHPSVVSAVLESGLPAVIDADALNLIAGSPALRALLRPQHVLTPHPGEAARLVGRSEDAFAALSALRTLGATVLYKGAATLIAGRHVALSASGTSGMATGGSGDVLSGLLGALLAAGLQPETAAWAASELHGLAGEAAALRLTDIALTSRDLIDYFPAAFSGQIR